ncbi:MAG TPA: IPTL-CTERM sorting domain-containing protein [Brevundimonas sp.]
MKSVVGLGAGLLLFLTATPAAADPDLSISLFVEPQWAQPGGHVRFIATVANSGPGAIQTNAEIRLPVGLTARSFGATGGSIRGSPSRLLVEDIVLEAGAVFTMSTGTSVSLNAVPGSLLTADAEVFPQAPEADATNNRATATMSVGAAPATPVPTLTEWAMILLGAGLVGGAALTLHRRRQFH